VQTVTADVAIIGAGIVGSSAALFLRQHGRSVVLVDADQPGAKASGVNYGGVRRQGRPLEQLPLSQRAHALWGRIHELIGIDGEYVRSGHVKFARTESDMASLQAYYERTKNFGLGLILMTPAQLRQRYPWLGPSVAGASLCPEDGHANPRLVSPAFARAAARLGATVKERTRVLRVEHANGRFLLTCDDGSQICSEILLNCAGAWAAQIALQFGESVPESAIHPVMAVTEPVPHFLDVNIGMEGGGIYMRQVARGNCVMGGARGAASDDQFARPVTHAVSEIARRAVELIPGLANAQIIRCWSGYEGSFPDHNPVIGPSRTVSGLFHGFGFSGAGFQIGPAAGEALAELVTKGQASVSLDAFRVNRFEREAQP
jgi:sarcosine oxidase subunit beta